MKIEMERRKIMRAGRKTELRKMNIKTEGQEDGDGKKEDMEEDQEDRDRRMKN